MEMNANELRIGNLVYLDDLDIDTGKWYQKIKGIDYRDIYNLIEGHEMVKQSYEPIPITEELLLRFGFEEVYKSPMHSTFWIGSLTYYFWHEKFHQYANFQGTQISCQYIHQLQNLIFALTGEELTIKNNQK